MARFKDAEPILAAAAQWKSRCLLGGRSLFTERQLWTRENFAELRRVYVDSLDEDGPLSGSFLERLEQLLEPASADAKCLWAEMAWVYHLARKGKFTTKFKNIRRVWGWSGREFPKGGNLLSGALLSKGIANIGVAYLIQAWREYRFFVAAMLEWFELDEARRERLLNEPWDFAFWLDATPFNVARQLRHVLLFLLFPDDFESVFSWKAKKEILEGYGKLSRLEFQLESRRRIALDRALVDLRRSLEQRDKDEEVHFYRSPWMEEWRDGEPPPPPRYTVDQACWDLFISRERFESILASIKSRKNLILQGPPGTGKTFVARRIAWCVIGREDSDPVEMVQFHQSYAYEDFVQGWRPIRNGGFELKDGVFHRFCHRARKNPDTPHVFIIDEINRGNLSRIFGELLMLIEADKRGEEHAVVLTYSDESRRFHVPANVYILGLMNTADRSLALVDYALRRRFAFERLEPAFGRDEFRQHLLREGVAPEVVDVVVKGMRDLNDMIRGDSELGRGFAIGHSYFVPPSGEEVPEDWHARIVDTQILPLVQEYWFDSPGKVEKARRLFDLS